MDRLRKRVPWFAPLVLWSVWGAAGYFLAVRTIGEVRVIEWQYAHPPLDWIANQVQFSGQVSFLITLLLVAGWSAGAYILYRVTAHQRRGR